MQQMIPRWEAAARTTVPDRAGWTNLDQEFVSITLAFIGEAAFGLRFDLHDKESLPSRFVDLVMLQMGDMSLATFNPFNRLVRPLPSSNFSSFSSSFLSFSSSRLPLSVVAFAPTFLAFAPWRPRSLAWPSRNRPRRTPSGPRRSRSLAPARISSSTISSPSSLPVSFPLLQSRTPFTLPLSGFDTTAHSLSFVVYQLLNNPECLDKAVKEVDEVLEGSKLPSSDHLNRLPYLTMCIKVPSSYVSYSPLRSFSRQETQRLRKRSA